MSTNSALKGKQVWMQCTWTNVFLNARKVKAECLRTYNRYLLNMDSRRNFNGSHQACMFDPKYKEYLHLENAIKNFQIGELTGQISEDGKFYEIRLLYCDRAALGWAHVNDIWFNGKGGDPNKQDWPYIPYTPETGVQPDPEPEKKKSNWLAWIAAGVTILSSLR
ncbi:MAG: hypothetical protein QM800_12700 [Paludibacter sp.]